MTGNYHLTINGGLRVSSSIGAKTKCPDYKGPVLISEVQLGQNIVSWIIMGDLISECPH